MIQDIVVVRSKDIMNKPFVCLPLEIPEEHLMKLQVPTHVAQ